MEKILHIEDDCLFGGDKRVAQFLVEIDVHVSLLLENELVWMGHVYYQPLKYWGFPFRCSRCFKTRHLHRTCHSSSKNGLGMQRDPTQLILEDIYMDERSDKDEGSTFDGSLMGNLKFFCLVLFSSLSIEEKLYLNNLKLGDVGLSSPPSKVGSQEDLLAHSFENDVSSEKGSIGVGMIE